MSEPVPVRCAIYTRKSTEEGLKQEFNSLQAQREAAEAYILSQRQSGWTAIPEQYDDGGFSGAGIDRPAIQRLLADVRSGQIDCVVVYKVDRLSRSLLDFARLMEMFEANDVSFVSVTQDFNTSSSLGRLTLHILLSFAQFEKEIIGERTRDKLSAARRKGKWTGGCPVLGYDLDPQGGGLRVNAGEAEQVRGIFRTASNADDLDHVLIEVNAAVYRTKAWQSRGGTTHGGKPFTRTSLARLLSNPLYIGEVLHKGERYQGEHAAIISEESWRSAQRHLRLRPKHLASRIRIRRDGLLKNILHCAVCEQSMRVTCTRRQERVYRYYVCPQHRAGCSGSRVSADEMETSVVRYVEPMVGSQVTRSILQQELDRVTYHAASRRVAVVFRDGTHSEYELPQATRTGIRQLRAKALARIPRISRLMALAIRLETLVREGRAHTFRELAEAGQISPSRMSQIRALTELAPSIQEELLFLPKIVAGRDRICESGLRKIACLTDWEAQLEAFRTLKERSETR